MKTFLLILLVFLLALGGCAVPEEEGSLSFPSNSGQSGTKVPSSEYSQVISTPSASLEGTLYGNYQQLTADAPVIPTKECTILDFEEGYFYTIDGDNYITLTINEENQNYSQVWKHNLKTGEKRQFGNVGTVTGGSTGEGAVMKKHKKMYTAHYYMDPETLELKAGLLCIDYENETAEYVVDFTTRYHNVYTLFYFAILGEDNFLYLIQEGYEDKFVCLVEKYNVPNRGNTNHIEK